MTTLPLRALAVMVFFTGAAIVAAEDTPEAPSAPTKPSRAELRDKQLDVSLDARDIERILTRLKRASELSKQRMTDAAAAAEGVSGAIERGDSGAARQRAEETAKMFQEIAKQLEALLTEETPQRVAAARNLAAQLAKAEQQFAQESKKLSQQMQSAPTAPGKGESDKPPTNTKAPGGQGKKSSDDPMNDDKPKGSGGNPKTPEEAPMPNGAGQANEKSEPKKDAAGGGTAKPKDEETGKKPDDTEKDPAGGGDDDKPNAGGGGGNSKEERDPDTKTSGSGGKREPMTPEARQQKLADRAEELANRAATLLDI
ncbi:MAG TPA: hypothetical protein VFG20_21750, partial [Planctomycetaceae bacterium]|nr:hypothetical protein [Planctomycetaceae bacterium]